MSEERPRAERGTGPPRTYAPLPDRPQDKRAAFQRHLAELVELVELVGADLPAAVPHGREWEQHARAAIWRTLDGSRQLPERLLDAVRAAWRPGDHPTIRSFS